MSAEGPPQPNEFAEHLDEATKELGLLETKFTPSAWEKLLKLLADDIFLKNDIRRAEALLDYLAKRSAKLAPKRNITQAAYWAVSLNVPQALINAWRNRKSREKLEDSK